VTFKVVSDVSSSLDDPRERAETLQADHRNMTKFWGRDDPNYLKVGGELRRIMAASPEQCLIAQTVPPMPPTDITNPYSDICTLLCECRSRSGVFSARTF
jgi:hypothetical protein